MNSLYGEKRKKVSSYKSRAFLRIKKEEAKK